MQNQKKVTPKPRAGARAGTPVGTPASVTRPRRFIRPTRFFAALWRVLAVLLVIALFISGWATLENVTAPMVQPAYAATGPAGLAVVRRLERDSKTNTLYAGSNAGVFKSSDDGVTWTPASHGLPGIDVQDMLFDPQTSTMYTVLFGVGLFRSPAGEDNWQNISRGFRGSELLTVAVDQRTGVLYAGLRGYGLYTSKNGGASWETIGFGLSNTNIRALLTGPQPGEVFAATDLGVFHSTQITGTWDLLTGAPGHVSAWSLLRDDSTGILYAGTEQGVLKLEPRNGDFLASLTGMTQGTVQALLLDAQTKVMLAGTLNGVYVSKDMSASWTPASNGLSSTLVHTLVQAPQGGGTMLLAGTDSGVFRSTDGAATWQAAALNPQARHVQAVLVNQPGGVMVAGTLGGGVFRSTDGGARWSPINVGLGNAVVQALGAEHGAGMLYAGTRKGLYRAALDSLNWTLASPRIADDDIQTLAVDERHGNVYAVNANGDVWRSSSGGTAWELVRALGNAFARTVAVSSYSSAVYVGAYKGGVLVSHDFGFTWYPLGDLPDKNVETLAVDESNGTLYAGTLNGAVFKLVDERRGWQAMGDGLPGNVVALAVDEQSGALFAALKAGLYRIGPDERAWQPAMTGLSHTNVLALGVQQDSSTVVAGVMAGGLFLSTNNGSTWRPASDGLTDTEMRNIVADDASGALYVSVTDRGVFRSDDGGQTWRVQNIGLSELNVRGMAASNGTLTFITPQRQYQSADGAATWQARAATWGNPLDLLFTQNAYGMVSRLPSGELLWAASGGGELWARTAANPGMVRATVRTASDWSQFVGVWGAELAQMSAGVSLPRVPLAWMLVRWRVWQTLHTLSGLATGWWLVPLAVLLLALLLVVLGRVRLSRRFGVPLRVALLTPNRSVPYARPAALERAWPRWERAVQGELYGYGDVMPHDLPGVPGPFRLYALKRFAETYGGQQSMELTGNRLHATARDQMRRWVNAWQALRGVMLRQGAAWEDRKQVDTLAAAFAATLGLKLSAPRDVDAVRAYAAEERLAGRIPLALLFSADNEALARTLQNLSTALDTVGTAGTVGVVISLGRPGRDIDVTNQVRNTIAEFKQSKRLFILSNNDVLNLMAAHDPAQALAQQLEQR
jgi:hypothetical protein